MEEAYTIANQLLETKKTSKEHIFYRDEYRHHVTTFEDPLYNGSFDIAGHDVESSTMNLLCPKESLGFTPSEYLQKFFEGPTVTDSGMMLDAAMKYAVCRLIGTGKFNDAFSMQKMERINMDKDGIWPIMLKSMPFLHDKRCGYRMQFMVNEENDQPYQKI